LLFDCTNKNEKEEGRRKKEEGRRKKEEGRRKVLGMHVHFIHLRLDSRDNHA
jgi:hypothetical protein